jgi:hypothetical protein
MCVRMFADATASAPASSERSRRHLVQLLGPLARRRVIRDSNEQRREFLDQFIWRIGQHGVDHPVLPHVVVAFEDWPQVRSQRLAVDVIPRIKDIVDALYAADPPLSLAHLWSSWARTPAGGSARVIPS